MKLKVSSKVHLNLAMLSKMETEAKLNALHKTAEWVLSEVRISKKIPKLTGELERSGFVTVNFESVKLAIARIIFDTPYARRWYFNTEGVVFRKEYNSAAQDHWMDEFIHGDRANEVIDVFIQFYREELGDILK